MYYKLLNQERRKNKRLGYGSNKKNWERKEYEEQRRRTLNIKEVVEITEIRNKEEIKPASTKEAFG